MMLPVFLISLSCALVVLMAGLFFLAYAKKEGLGKFSKIAAYVAIVFGTFVFLGGITAATLGGCCHKAMCNKSKTECPMMSKCDKGGDAACSMKSHCDKGGDACPMKSHCDKNSDSCKKEAGCEKGAEKKCCADSTAKM
jgi:hypothetical protein